MPFPFLVWTPSGYSWQGYTAIAAQGVIQDRTTVIPMSATRIRAATTPTRTGPAIIAGTFTATAIIGVGTTASDTIAGEGSNGLRTQNVTCSPSLDIVPQTVAL